MGQWFSGLVDMFYTKKLDIVLIGLAGAGKTTFSNAIALTPTPTKPAQETVPTIGLEIQIFQKDGVTFKVWDLGGQSAYRSEWPRYVRGSDVIVLIIDTQHPFDLMIVKKELHGLLEDPSLSKVPILILANKIDLGPKIQSEQEIVEGLNLDYVTDNQWLIIQCSAKTGENIDKALQFLTQHGK